MALLIVGAYIGTAALSRSRDDVAVKRCMAVGVAVGTIAALVTGVAIVDSAVVATQADPNGNAGWVLVPLLVIAPIAAGMLGVLSYRSTSVPDALQHGEVTGALAGFWCSMAFCVVVSTIGLATNVIFADHLASTAWAADARYGVPGGDLIASEIGDQLGATAFLLTLGPILGLGGAVGGVVASTLFRPRTTAGRVPRSWRAEWVAVGFMAAMVTLAIVGVGTHLF